MPLSRVAISLSIREDNWIIKNLKVWREGSDVKRARGVENGGSEDEDGLGRSSLQEDVILGDYVQQRDRLGIYSGGERVTLERQRKVVGNS